MVLMRRHYYTMKVLTSLMGKSIGEFILNGLLGYGSWLEELGHWSHMFLRYTFVPVLPLLCF